MALYVLGLDGLLAIKRGAEPDSHTQDRRGGGVVLIMKKKFDMGAWTGIYCSLLVLLQHACAVSYVSCIHFSTCVTSLSWGPPTTCSEKQEAYDEETFEH